MLGNQQPEEAFLAGLLSDIGTLAMHQGLGAEYDALLEKCGGDQVELVRLSREKFDLDHAQVGGALAQDWKFPPAMVEPIRQHHTLEKIGSGSRGLVEIVYGGVLCGQVFAAKRTGLLAHARRELSGRFKLDDAKITALFKEIDSHSEELADLFEVTIEPGRSYHEIEQEARQALVELTLQTQIQSQELARQNKHLQQKATTDGLTGLANRVGLAAFIEKALADLRDSGIPFSVLMLDLDKFKSVNDTHGHQAGDEVLQRVGKLLMSLIDDCDLAARYGGEELAVVLSRKDVAGAIAQAERIRAAIQGERFIFAGKTAVVTASVGVATADSQAGFASYDELIGAADRALYAAKEAGRNRVRHCAPRGIAAPREKNRPLPPLSPTSGHSAGMKFVLSNELCEAHAK